MVDKDGASARLYRRTTSSGTSRSKMHDAGQGKSVDPWCVERDSTNPSGTGANLLAEIDSQNGAFLGSRVVLNRS